MNEWLFFVLLLTLHRKFLEHIYYVREDSLTFIKPGNPFRKTTVQLANSNFLLLTVNSIEKKAQK